MNPKSYYSTDGDLAVIYVRPSNSVRTEEHDWGLVDRDVESGEVATIELWHASKRFPQQLLEIFPRLGRSDATLTREDLAKA
jgi:uncharacterized protein YuzE